MQVSKCVAAADGVKPLPTLWSLSQPPGFERDAVLIKPRDTSNNWDIVIKQLVRARRNERFPRASAEATAAWSRGQGASERKVTKSSLQRATEGL